MFSSAEIVFPQGRLRRCDVLYINIICCKILRMAEIGSLVAWVVLGKLQICLNIVYNSIKFTKIL